MFLASQVEGFSKIYFIRHTKHADKWKEVFKFLGYAFKKGEILFKAYEAHRPGFILLDYDLPADKVKAEIRKTTRRR